MKTYEMSNLAAPNPANTKKIERLILHWLPLLYLQESNSPLQSEITSNGLDHQGFKMIAHLLNQTQPSIAPPFVIRYVE